jgi:hypothetical protein
LAPQICLGIEHLAQISPSFCDRLRLLEFVCEASPVTLESYADRLGRDATARETWLIGDLLGCPARAPGEPTAAQVSEVEPLIRWATPCGGCAPTGPRRR